MKLGSDPLTNWSSFRKIHLQGKETLPDGSLDDNQVEVIEPVLKLKKEKI